MSDAKTRIEARHGAFAARAAAQLADRFPEVVDRDALVEAFRRAILDGALRELELPDA